jgi:hypothetical protein
MSKRPRKARPVPAAQLALFADDPDAPRMAPGKARVNAKSSREPSAKRAQPWMRYLWPR